MPSASQLRPVSSTATNRVAFALPAVQVLPVNDTSVYGMWWDSYPYSSLSVFALHPLYLRLEALVPPDQLPADVKDAIGMARAKLEGKQASRGCAYVLRHFPAGHSTF